MYSNTAMHCTFSLLHFSTFLCTGGMMSVFLMGLHDSSTGKFCTVAKCGNGHDDATIAKLQDELDMVKISKVVKIASLKNDGLYNTRQMLSSFLLCFQDASKVPSWLLVNKSVVPDLVIRDPKASCLNEHKVTAATEHALDVHCRLLYWPRHTIAE